MNNELNKTATLERISNTTKQDGFPDSLSSDDKHQFGKDLHALSQTNQSKDSALTVVAYGGTRKENLNSISKVVIGNLKQMSQK